MIGLVRAAALCAMLALGLVSAQAADKAFKRDDLADSAIKLEAQIKSEAGTVAKSARRCEPMPTPPSSAAISAPACRSSARSRPPRRTTAATGCGWRAPSSRSGRRTPANRPSCWSAPRPRPISPTSAPTMLAKRRMRWRCSAARCPTASCGVRRWTACGCRSICARSPRCAASTKRCATSTASGCSITPWIPIRHRRAPVSSSPRTSPSASTFRRSWRWPAATSRRCRRKASSFASTASSTANATTSICAPGCHPR